MDSELYYGLCRGDTNYKGNMPEYIAKMFLVLFDDESWTWSGLAKLMRTRFTSADMEEFVSLLTDK